MKTWNVSEITVEAMDVKRPGLLTLPCSSVSLEEKSYETAGFVVETRYRPESLLAKGIDLNRLREITWEPNRVSFVDSVTSQQRSYTVLSVKIIEPDTAEFNVGDEFQA